MPGSPGSLGMVYELRDMHYMLLLVLSLTPVLDRGGKTYACLLINSSVLGAILGIECAEYSVFFDESCYSGKASGI
jgi:hypothetical protein